MYWQFTKNCSFPRCFEKVQLATGAFWTCQQRWLFDSDYCFDSYAVGKFNDGFKVVLADTPCVDQGSCPLKRMFANMLWNHTFVNGVRRQHIALSKLIAVVKLQKYVRIILPGNNRILIPNFNIQVYRAEPKIIDPNKMIGYALEQAEPTQTRPPYIFQMTLKIQYFIQHVIYSKVVCNGFRQ